MKNILTVLLSLALLSSCGNKEDKVDVVVNTEITPTVEMEVLGEFSNPAIIYGTDFLTFFKSLRKLGNIDEMIKFTSSESLDEFGEEELKTYYQEKFTNMSNSKLTSMDKIGDSTYVMHYLNSEFATKRAFDVRVTVESDSVKLNLLKKYPF